MALTVSAFRRRPYAAVVADVPAAAPQYPLALPPVMLSPFVTEDDVHPPTCCLCLADDASHPKRLIVGMGDDDEHRAVRRWLRVRVALPIDLHLRRRRIARRVRCCDLDGVQPGQQISIEELDVEIACVRQAVVGRPDQQRVALTRVQPVRERPDPVRVVDVAEDVDPALRHADLPERLRAAPPDDDARSGGAGGGREHAVAGDGLVPGRVGRADAVVIGRRAGESRKPCALSGQLPRRHRGLAVRRRQAPVHARGRELVRRPRDRRRVPVRDSRDRGERRRRQIRRRRWDDTEVVDGRRERRQAAAVTREGADCPRDERLVERQ